MAEQVKSVGDGSSESKATSQVNKERVQQLQKLQDQVRTGGKGTPRRKKKVVHHNTLVKDDKQLQNTLKKLGANPIPGIEEVNLFRNDGTVINIKNPKVQTALACNTFSVAGNAVEKPVTEMFPSILNQMGPEGFIHLRNLNNILNTARTKGAAGAEKGPTAAGDDDVPVPQENFDAKD